MNRHLLLPAVFVPLFFTGCDNPKPDESNRMAELEKRVAAAEQEAADARAAQDEIERLLEEQRLAVQRDALERERLDLERQRAESERVQQEEARVAEEQLRGRESELATRELSASQLEAFLAEQQKTLDERTAELSEQEKELAGREALPEPVGAAPAPATEPEPVDVRDFYDTLSPYGSWFDSPTYGYVWRPTVHNSVGWRPYSRGRWACTDRGWMWISDEPFGWATYHYGRWALCRVNGWIWVPGNEWAPSWVCWRTSGTHVGWAPLPPETLAFRGRHWGTTVEVSFGIGSAWFCFVETRNFCRPIHLHCLPHSRNDHFWGNTANVTNIHHRNNRVICGGPSYGDIARQTDRRPPFYRIEEDRSGRPGRDGIHNRIEKGRVVVTPPRREESRNPDAVANRPSRISGRFDQVDVVRTKPLDQEIVREFQKNREEARKPGAPPKEITQRPTQRGEEPKTDARGEEQRRLNEKAQDLEKQARNQEDDRIRVLPRPAGEVRQEEPKTHDRGEEQRRLNEKAQDLEKEARKNVDDRIRVLPRSAEETSGGTSRPPQPPIAPPSQTDRRGEEQRRLNEKAQNLEKEARKNVDDRIRVLPRSAEETLGGQEQQRQAEEQQRRRVAEEAQRQQQQRVTEESARRQAEAQRETQRQQQQRQAEEGARRQAEAQREAQLQKQQRAAEESARRQAEAQREAQRQQQQRQAEEAQRRAAEEGTRRQAEAQREAQLQKQQRQLEEQQRRQLEEQQRRNRQ